MTGAMFSFSSMASGCVASAPGLKVKEGNGTALGFRECFLACRGELPLRRGFDSAMLVDTEGEAILVAGDDDWSRRHGLVDEATGFCLGAAVDVRWRKI